jgi:hypothetical protein
MVKTKQYWAVISDNGHLIFDEIENLACICRTKKEAEANRCCAEKIVKVTVTYEVTNDKN